MNKRHILICLCITSSIFAAEKKEEPQSKIDFLKEKVIGLMDTQKEDQAKMANLLRLNQEYVQLAEATMIHLNNTVKKQKETIEQLESQQSLTMHQEEIIALKATVQKQKTTINQLRSQQPLITHNESSKSKLQRRLTK